MIDRELTVPGSRRHGLFQSGLALLGVFSVLILFSFGGQLIVAPALLPAQWIIARNTDGWPSTLFSVLGSLLLAEVTWLGFAVLLDAGTQPLAIDYVLVFGAVVAGVLFFRTSRPPAHV
jgi:hypothetical protein